MFTAGDIVLVKAFACDRHDITDEEREIINEVHDVIGKITYADHSVVSVEFDDSVTTKTEPYKVEHWNFRAHHAEDLLEVIYQV